MRINGTEYGTLLASKNHFKQAVQSNPTAELIQLSCGPARGSAAHSATTSLHTSGIGLPTHASEELVFTRIKVTGGLVKQEGSEIADIGSIVDYDQAGNIKKSPWVRHPAPWESTER